MVVFPGVQQLVVELSSQIPLAIASGALRSEIELILEKFNLRQCFRGIVSTEDVDEGKPNPEIFNKALDLLNQVAADGSIDSSECLAIEDSREGIRAAHGARLKCLAVTNSHSEKELFEADSVVHSLEQVNLNFLEKLLR
jgi:HAD superfamily hydrolase (TIGR01509 family)